MICTHCGANNFDEAIFCQKCGKRFETTEQAGPTLLSSPPVPSSPYGSLSHENTAYGSSEPSYAPPPPSVSYPPDLYGQQLPVLASPQKSRKGVWAVLSIIGIVLLLLITWGGYMYANRSTPAKTLQTFCDAAQNHNYQVVYDQYSSDSPVKTNYTETQYVSRVQNYVRTHGNLINCTVSSVNENNSSATAIVTTYYSDGTSQRAITTLTNENGVWKISKDVVAP